MDWRKIHDLLSQSVPDAEPEPFRRLSANDHQSFYDAGTERANTKTPEPTLERARRDLKLLNRVRWWQMRRDFAWAQKQLARMGYNPEDARFLFP